MRTIAQEQVRNALVTRLHRLTPDAKPRWGVMTAGEMLCHLGDAHEGVAGSRVTPGRPATGPGKPLVKWFALRTPFPWPRGIRTRPGVDPRIDGTRPGEFDADLTRAITSLHALAQVEPERLAPIHPLFGPMSAWDWHRWAYRHLGHHLRQFGL